MKKTLFKKKLWALILLTWLLLMGCSLEEEERVGSLSIDLTESCSRILLPDINMDIKSYIVKCFGPNNAILEQTVTPDASETTHLEIKNLALGEWALTVEALNLDTIPVIIGYGSKQVTVKANETTIADIDITPIAGTGNMDLTVMWEEQGIVTPQLDASLISSDGVSTSLDFIIDGVDNNKANYSKTGLDSGYYTLIIKLYDNKQVNSCSIAGIAEVVRIINGGITAGKFAFYNLGAVAGNMSINIDMNMYNPLNVAIAGAASTKELKTNMVLTANITNYTDPAIYAWYVNGKAVNVSNSSLFTLDSTYDEQFYNISVTAFSIDGKRAGSKTVSIEVK